MHEDRKSPIVSVYVAYEVSSKDEPAGKTGFAHLFEHLMFNGSENFDQDFFLALQDMGATNYNGTTGTDSTDYFQTVPKNALEQILFLESDRMGHLLGAVTPEKLKKQIDVVKNEKRQADAQPLGSRLWHEISKNLYPVGHPYHHSPIGSMADLDNAAWRTCISGSKPTTVRRMPYWCWRGTSMPMRPEYWLKSTSATFPRGRRL